MNTQSEYFTGASIGHKGSNNVPVVEAGGLTVLVLLIDGVGERARAGHGRAQARARGQLLLGVLAALQPLLLQVGVAAPEGHTLGELEQLKGVAHLLRVVDAHDLDVLELVEGVELVLVAAAALGGGGGEQRVVDEAVEGGVGVGVGVGVGEVGAGGEGGLGALALRQCEQEGVVEQVGVQFVRDCEVVEVERFQVTVE